MRTVWFEAITLNILATAHAAFDDKTLKFCTNLLWVNAELPMKEGFVAASFIPHRFSGVLGDSMTMDPVGPPKLVTKCQGIRKSRPSNAFAMAHSTCVTILMVQLLETA